MNDEHLHRTFQWLQDPNLCSLIDSFVPHSLDAHLALWKQRVNDSSRLSFAIEDGAGTHIGNCGLTQIDRVRAKAELWIYLPLARRRGLGAAAVGSLLAHGFHNLLLHRVYLRVLATNLPALVFYRKFGFIEEGRWRDDTLVAGGYVDSIWFSMLDTEFKEMQRGL